MNKSELDLMVALASAHQAQSIELAIQRDELLGLAKRFSVYLPDELQAGANAVIARAEGLGQ